MWGGGRASRKTRPIAQRTVRGDKEEKTRGMGGREEFGHPFLHFPFSPRRRVVGKEEPEQSHPYIATSFYSFVKYIYHITVEKVMRFECRVPQILTPLVSRIKMMYGLPFSKLGSLLKERGIDGGWSSTKKTTTT